MDMSDKVNVGNSFRWVNNHDEKGKFLFTFDGKEIFNLFQDYPYKLTKEQKKMFDEENPFWASFFEDRN